MQRFSQRRRVSRERSFSPAIPQRTGHACSLFFITTKTPRLPQPLDNGRTSPLASSGKELITVVVIEQRMLALRASSGNAQEVPAISAASASLRETCQGKR